MFIFSFYAFTILYTYIFARLISTVVSFSYSTVIIIIFSLIIGLVLSLITQLLIIWIILQVRKNKEITNKFNHWFAKDALKLGVHLLHTKITVSGKENIPNKPFILVGNHQENYDILIIMPIFKQSLSFIAKEVLAKMPIFGEWMKVLGNVFITRDADRQAAIAILQGIKNYKQGLSMAIFPEGKRSFSNEMLDFKPGAFKLAIKAKADIVIVSQYNVCTIFKKFQFKPYDVKLHVHPLLKYDDYQHMTSHELAVYVKNEIQKQLDIFRKSDKQ